MSGAKYRITNWSEYQHYKDRNPPWIKLHFALLASKDWVMLDDAGRVLAVACMLLASRSDVPGDLELDSDYIKRVAYLNSDPDFKPLIDSGFLEPLADASTMQADARPEERRGETEKEEMRARRTRICPDDFVPNQIMVKQATIQPGVDIDQEFSLFKLHEFAQPKSDWDRTWIAWLTRAKPTSQRGDKDQKTTTALMGFANG